MANEFAGPIWLSLQLAFTTVLFLLGFGIPLAAWLNSSRSSVKAFIEALVSLPLLLPPTVIGFYLLLAFSPANAFGNWLDENLGIRLVFSFSGIVIGSFFFSLPFFLNPFLTALRALSPSLRESSLSLGKGEWTTFFRILLPNAKQGLITGIVMAFAHAMGEFGVVLMLGGSIPGVTRVASIAIYDRFEAMDYVAAHTYAILLLSSSLFFLFLVFLFNRKKS